MALAFVVAALALGSGPTYRVAQVQASFRAETGVQLVRQPEGSTRSLTTLVSRPRVTARFGRFELNVLRPATARATRRAILQGRRPDARGIYWVPTQNIGVTAITVFGTNLVVDWSPPRFRRVVDARWRRLQAAVRALDP